MLGNEFLFFKCITLRKKGIYEIFTTQQVQVQTNVRVRCVCVRDGEFLSEISFINEHILTLLFLSLKRSSGEDSLLSSLDI